MTRCSTLPTPSNRAADKNADDSRSEWTWEGIERSSCIMSDRVGARSRLAVAVTFAWPDKYRARFEGGAMIKSNRQYSIDQLSR